jgi:hypothetical protein
MHRGLLFAFVAAVLAGCASHAPPVPSNVSFGAPDALPTPLLAANDAPPRILAMRFSSDDVKRGQTWSGRIVTTTNVASVEVRSNLFSINVPRTNFGRFAFQLRIFDVPPIFLRGYRLRVIARNSAGEQAEEDLPFRIR